MRLLILILISTAALYGQCTPITLNPFTGKLDCKGTGGPGGAGTVTVVSSGNLTTNAVVTGGGLQTIQTGTGATVDADGDAVFKSVTTSDTTVAGEIRVYELNDAQTNYRSWMAPDTLTANLAFRLPDALPAGGETLTWGAPVAGISQGTLTPLTRSFGAVFNGGGSVLTAGTTVGSQVLYSPPIPIGCTVTAWSVTVDAGTAGFRVWRVAAGANVPTVANTLNTGDLAITTGTNLRSTTMTNFTGATAPVLVANDILAFQLNAAASATYAAVSLQCQ